MNKRKVQAFITRLKLARAAVERGDTGCTDSDKCWYCAVRKRSGSNGKNFWKFIGPNPKWSFDRPRSDTLAMFDNSIAALKKQSTDDCGSKS